MKRAAIAVAAGALIFASPARADTTNDVRWEVIDIPGEGFGKVASACIYGLRVFVAKETGSYSGNPLAIVGDNPRCEP